MTPDKLYALGTGDHSMQVKLTRLYDPDPVVIYDGPAIIHLQTIDRVAQKKRVRGYADEDFYFSIEVPGINWAESSRSSYEAGGGHVPSAYVVEDYQTEIFPL